MYMHTHNPHKPILIFCGEDVCKTQDVHIPQTLTVVYEANKVAPHHTVCMHVRVQLIIAVTYASIDYYVTLHVLRTIVHITESPRSRTIFLPCPLLILFNIRGSICWD